jgi:hypothetical protein
MAAEYRSLDGRLEDRAPLILKRREQRLEELRQQIKEKVRNGSLVVCLLDKRDVCGVVDSLLI